MLLSIGLSILAIGFAAIMSRIILSDRGWMTAMLNWPVLRSIGTYSFAMYVVQTYSSAWR